MITFFVKSINVPFAQGLPGFFYRDSAGFHGDGLVHEEGEVITFVTMEGTVTIYSDLAQAGTSIRKEVTLTPRVGATYILDWSSNSISEQKATPTPPRDELPSTGLTAWLPMPPNMGPPLPQFLNIRWPGLPVMS
jgi:hypothetical protein